MLAGLRSPPPDSATFGQIRPAPYRFAERGSAGKTPGETMQTRKHFVRHGIHFAFIGTRNRPLWFGCADRGPAIIGYPGAWQTTDSLDGHMDGSAPSFRTIAEALEAAGLVAA